MWRRLCGVWIFDAGAWLYDCFTANAVWQANCARLLDGIPLSQERLRVLDLGVGPGVSALAMGRQRPPAHFIGLDLSQRMLAIAGNHRLKAGWPSERLSLLRGDAFQLPLVDGGLDAITAHSFLYLLPHRRVALAEAKRILRPGGYVAFLEPHAGQVSWSWLLGQVSIRLLTSISLWRLYSWLHARFSAESLGITLQEAGFVNITTEVTLGGFGIFGRAQKP